MSDGSVSAAGRDSGPSGTGGAAGTATADSGTLSSAGGMSNDGSSDASRPSPVDLPDGAAVAIVGTVRGAPLGDVDAFSFVQTHDGSTFLSVRVVSFPHACTDVVSMVQRNTFHQTSYGIDLNISNQSGEVAPGTYPVNVTYPSEMPIGDVRVNAAFVHNDPQCVQQSIFASSGTIQLDEVTASRIGGSFDLFIGEPPLGRLRGSFAAPSCDAFATVTTFPDAGAGACLP